MLAEVINFNTEDGCRLDGLLYGSNFDKVIIYIHGMGGSSMGYREDLFASQAVIENFSLLAFDNRSAHIVKRFSYNIENKHFNKTQGGAFAELDLAIKDISAAINYCKNKGFKKIYLFGLCMGAFKIIQYFIHNKDERVNAVALLSLPENKNFLKKFLGAEYSNVIDLAKLNIKTNNENFMPKNSFLMNIGSKVFYDLFANEKYNLIEYKEPFNNELWNKLPKNLFIRFVKEKETISVLPKEAEELLKKNLKNKQLNIKTYQIAGHSYYGKEKETIKEFISFIGELNESK